MTDEPTEDDKLAHAVVVKQWLSDNGLDGCETNQARRVGPITEPPPWPPVKP